MQLSPAQRDAILRDDFLSFAQAGFHLLEPNKTFEPNWHHEAIAQMLLLSNSEKTRKYINAPPRSLKSFLLSVAWVAYKLGHEPSHKFICSSYSRDLANHLAAQCRKLMQSELYQRLFSTRLVKISEDELSTTQGGFRISTSVGATLTGLGGDTLIIDDPMNASEAFSETSRKTANNWFTGTLMSRLNDKRRGSIFVVSQRLHQEDLTGFLIEAGWDGLVFPAIAPRDIVMEIGSWRHEWREGEPLQAREPLDVLEDQKRQLSEVVFAAQYMQDPVPEAGNLLKRDWLKWAELSPVRQPVDQIVQSWDTAVKVTTTSDYSVCLTFLVRNNNEYYLIDIWRQKVAFPDLCAEVVNQAAKHKPNAILIEDQSSGSPLIDECNSRGMTGVIGRRSSSDKATRMNGETAKLQGGSLILPKAAPWLDEFLMEYLAFPGGKHDDQIDALSQFLNWRTGAETSPPLIWDNGDDYRDGNSGDGMPGLSAPSPEQLLWRLRR
ncbi:MAG: putative phage terminase large subunit-like protein [Afipia broomeae]|jgi:predicted phage terminase large subunit-like protein|nr:MAG: terminase [Bradyrhizobiaceae bacterium]